MSEGAERVRAAEVVGALCLATDLGMGFPFEHGLHGTLIAMQLGERLGVDAETASDTYYASLLAHSGCTTEAAGLSEIFGSGLTTHLVPVMFGSPLQQFTGIVGALPTPGSTLPARATQIARRLPKAAQTQKPHLAAVCDVARTLSEQLGLPVSVQQLFHNLTERWDGKGAPLLFVHGTAGLGPYWAPVLRRLDGYRCLMVDRPGWGLSSAVDYSKHDYGTVTADVLRGVLDAFGLDRAHVVGASIGDVWALRLASRCPERVQRVVLLGGGPLLQDVAVPKVIRLLASPLGAIMVRAPKKPGRVRSVLRAVGHGGSLDSGRIPEEYVEWRAALGRYTDSMRHERAMVRTIVRGHRFRTDLTFDEKELTGIPHPTLLVYGKADPTGPLDLWERFIAALPHGSLHVTDGGHMPWLDDPGRVASLMKTFLAPA